MQTRMFDPNEEIAFHLTANEVNTLLAILDTTTGFPHRVVHPLIEKMQSQALAPQQTAAQVEVQQPGTDFLSPPSRQRLKGGNRQQEHEPASAARDA